LAVDKQLAVGVKSRQGSRGSTVPLSRVRWPRGPTLASRNRVPRGRIRRYVAKMLCLA